MKQGDLVKWSLSWLAGCTDRTEKRYTDQSVETYRKQIGVVTGKSKTVNCYSIVWSNGMTGDVHRDYLEALCK